MRLLLDQNIDRRFVAHLRAQGHDVTRVARDYPAGILDPDILAIALREERVLITNDTDFGELVIREHRAHAGVILLRLKVPDFATMRERLDRVLTDYAGQLDQLLVVSERRVRLRLTQAEPREERPDAPD